MTQKISQYYYHQNSCPAKYAGDFNCTCWHDEGTGPFSSERHDAPNTFLAWRLKQTNADLAVSQLESGVK